MNRLERFLISAGVGLLLFFASYALLTKGVSFAGIIRITACLMPLVIIVMMRLSSIWFALLLGSLSFTFTLPIPILSRLEPSMYILVLIGGIYLLRIALQVPRLNVFNNLESWTMGLCGTIIIGRFIVDRPGSALVGDVGGAGEAATYALGCIAYFLVALVTSENWPERQNLRVLIRWVLLGFILNLALGLIVPSYRPLFVIRLFGRPAWFLMPLLLALSLEREQRVPTESRSTHFPLPLVVIFATLIVSILTPFRSRPFFAVALICGTSFVYGKLRRFAVILIPVGICLLAILFMLGENRLSPRMARSLSTLLPIDEMYIARTARDYGMSSESGWTSRFRGHMYRMAWERIREKPWFGKGFVLSRSELIFAISGAQSFERATQSLALAGGYHNSVLTIAVFCGVPCAFFFLVCLAVGSRRFLRTCRGVESRHMRIIVATLLGFFLPCTGQMLMNGAAGHFYIVCVLLGAMRGLSHRLERKAQDSLPRLPGADALSAPLPPLATSRS